MKAMVVKVFGPRAGAGGEPTAHPTLGRQVQNRAWPPAPARPTRRSLYQTSERRLADGTVVQLQKPALDWRGPGRPERFSMRVARPLVGLGLLEAVPEAAILARADPGDCNADAHLRAGPTWPAIPRPAPCGWAASAGRRARSACATRSPTRCWSTWGSRPRSSPQSECAGGACPPEPRPSCPRRTSARLTTYMRALGVPPRRKLGDPHVQRGAAVFAASAAPPATSPRCRPAPTIPWSSCATRPSTPISDLLLHDMGPDLADDSEREFAALPSEWRTPPLWSIGLTRTVSGETRFLHDGRARSFLEAILWHGGEASLVRERAAALPTPDREALLEFLASL